LRKELELEKEKNLKLQKYLEEIQEWKEQLVAHIEVAPKSPY